MRTRTLPTPPRILAGGWSHPYPRTPLSPILYADGGDAGSEAGGEKGGQDSGGAGGDAGSGKDSGGSGSSDHGGDGGESGSGKDTGDDVDKWKNLARKHEARAKENASAAKELADLKAANATEQEKAVNEAVRQAVAEERGKGAQRLARQMFLAAASGRLDKPADVVEDVNLSRYIDADGEIDEDGLTKLIDRLAPAKSSGDEDGEGDGGEARRRRRGGFDQGARSRSGQRGGKGVSGDELFEELLGRKPRTASQT